MRFDRDRALGWFVAAALVGGGVYLLLQPGFVAYYFAGPGVHGPWWERAVWGNVWACVPCGVLAFLYARAKLAAHRREAEERHEELLASHAHIWKHVAATYESQTGERAEPHPLLDR